MTSLDFINASLSILQEQECVAQISVVYRTCSPLPSPTHPPINILQICIMSYLLQQKVPEGYNEHIKCTWTTCLYDYGHVSIALVCIYNGIQSDFDQHNITHRHCMNGEADNSRMYVYMHLAFKELSNKLKP